MIPHPLYTVLYRHLLNSSVVLLLQHTITCFVLHLKVLVGLNEKFQVADHDFHRGSIIPSVTLNINLPDSPTESFYDGEVSVILKDAIFQPSSAFRHAAETTALLKNRYEDDSMPSHLLLYTDGGPDHRCNFLSVMYSMVYMFIELDLDSLILARNAPGHSWRNPAKRTMSVINLGMQGLGVMREEADEENEKKIRK